MVEEKDSDSSHDAKQKDLKHLFDNARESGTDADPIIDNCSASHTSRHRLSSSQLHVNMLGKPILNKRPRQNVMTTSLVEKT